jgi:hypothetical protein
MSTDQIVPPKMPPLVLTTFHLPINTFTLGPGILIFLQFHKTQQLKISKMGATICIL